MDHPLPRSKVIRQWVVGLLSSWICVWLFGHWVVNSIHIRVYDPELRSITLREGDVVRWRSEGWATTEIGPHGLPGWKSNQSQRRVVLWGDSQLEGFCTEDKDKIASQLMRLSERANVAVDCIPIGRSGTDAVDWQERIEAADNLWDPLAHIFVVTELSDLICLDPRLPKSQQGDRWQVESPPVFDWVDRLRAEAFVQAARNVLLDPATGGIRSLRWSVGPPLGSTPLLVHEPIGEDVPAASERTAKELLRLSDRLNGRLWVVYAPAVPRFAGQVITTHPDDEAWEQLKWRLEQNSIVTIDCRKTFVEQWNRHGQVPRGFHVGKWSYGHLNATGNRLIAEAILPRLLETIASSGSASGDRP